MDRHWIVAVALALALLALPFMAHAQEPDPVENYELRVYLVGGVSPVTTYAFDASAVTCTGTPWPPPDPSNPPPVNPSIVAWNDDLGDGCSHTMTTLPSWPIPGQFLARLEAFNAAGASGESGDSNEFFTLAPPTAPAVVTLNP